jgi:hypothetical protein
MSAPPSSATRISVDSAGKVAFETAINIIPGLSAPICFHS